jgi:hypothetical protein
LLFFGAGKQQKKKGQWDLWKERPREKNQPAMALTGVNTCASARSSLFDAILIVLSPLCFWCFPRCLPHHTGWG